MKHILIAIISLFFIVGCGNSKKETVEKSKEIVTKKEEKPAKPSAVIVDSDGVANILITTNDVMKFNVKKLNVKAGQKVKLTLKHIGKLDKRIMGHNVVILNQGIKLSDFAKKAAKSKDNDYIPTDASDVIVHTKMIGGGESTTIEFTAPAVGIYDFICSFPAHFAMMKGKFIVE